MSTVSALSQSSDGATKVTPNVLLQEIRVNMNVLARKSSMSWKQGKVIEIVTKGKKKKQNKICCVDCIKEMDIASRSEK